MTRLRVGSLILVAGLTAGCASLPVSLSVVAADATACAIALASDAAAVAANPAVIGLAGAPSIAGVLSLLTSLQQLMPDTIIACSPFVADVSAEFSGKVVTPPTPAKAKIGLPTGPVQNPWKGLLGK